MSLPQTPPPGGRVVHAPRVLGAPGSGPAVLSRPGMSSPGAGSPLAMGPPSINQIELRKNLNEALLKRAAKAHHSAPGDIGPLAVPSPSASAISSSPFAGGVPPLPIRERGSTLPTLPPASSFVASQPSTPSSAPPPALPPREDLPPSFLLSTASSSTPTSGPGAAPSSPFKRHTVMLHQISPQGPMARSAGSLPILGGPPPGSPLRVGSSAHSGSDGSVHLLRANTAVGLPGLSQRRSVSDDSDSGDEKRSSGTWIHKRSLSSLVPRLSEMPTDPSLFDKAADAKKLGTKYERCFTGEMFVDWVNTLGLGHNKQEISELGGMLIKATLIVVLAGNDNFGTTKYDVYAMNDLNLGGLGSSALASAMGALSVNKKGVHEQKKKEKQEKKEEEKRQKEAKKLDKLSKKSTKTLERKGSKKKKNIKIFNTTLEEVLALQRGESADPELAAKYAGLEVPIALKLLCDKLLELTAYRHEGIFRISGTQEEMDKLKAQINDLNYDAIAACADVHIIAGLMKAFLRELTEPLVPASLYQRCITEGLADPAKANQLLMELPEINLKTAQFVINFLLRFLDPEHVAVTKMGIENVSMVFAPLFLRNESCDPTLMLLNASYESAFVQNLIQFYLERR